MCHAAQLRTVRSYGPKKSSKSASFNGLLGREMNDESFGNGSIIDRWGGSRLLLGRSQRDNRLGTPRTGTAIPAATLDCSRSLPAMGVR